MLDRKDIVVINKRNGRIGIKMCMCPIYLEEELKDPVEYYVLTDDYKSKKNKKRLDKNYLEYTKIQKNHLIEIGTL